MVDSFIWSLVTSGNTYTLGSLFTIQLFGFWRDIKMALGPWFNIFFPNLIPMRLLCYRILWSVFISHLDCWMITLNGDKLTYRKTGQNMFDNLYKLHMNYFCGILMYVYLLTFYLHRNAYIWFGFKMVTFFFFWKLTKCGIYSWFRPIQGKD